MLSCCIETVWILHLTKVVPVIKGNLQSNLGSNKFSLNKISAKLLGLNFYFSKKFDECCLPYFDFIMRKK